jgi:hypothetical protein
MTVPVCKEDLGSLIRTNRCCRTDDHRGKLFYLPQSRAIVVPEHRQGADWHCLVLANAADHTRRVSIADAEIDTAWTVLSCDPAADPANFALLWQARVWQHWPGGPMPTLARLIADDLRPPNGLTIELHQAAVRKLAHGARMLPSALALRIKQLVATGLLRPIQPGIGRYLGSYTMTIPQGSPRAAA